VKILLLTSSGHRVGGWFRCAPLGQALHRRGADVTLVNVSPVHSWRFSREVDRGLKIVEVPRLRGWRHLERGSRFPWDIAYRIGLIGAGSFDVVHGFCHLFNSALPLWSAPFTSPNTATLVDREDLWRDGGLRGPRRPAFTLAGINDRVDNWFESNSGRWTDAVTAVSEDLATRTISAGIDPARVFQLGNGCRVDEFSPGDPAAARRDLGLPLEPPLLLYAAMGTYDAFMVLDLMQQLPALGYPQARAVMLGNIGDDVRAEVQRRDLGRVVDVRGWAQTSQLRLFLQACDVGLMPMADTAFNRSRWPVKVGDYLSSGLPVAATRVGEVGKIVAESGAGVATAPDPEAFARGVADVLSSRGPALRALARRTAEARSWDVVAARAEEIYRTVLARPRAPQRLWPRHRSESATASVPAGPPPPAPAAAAAQSSPAGRLRQRLARAAHAAVSGYLAHAPIQRGKHRLSALVDRMVGPAHYEIDGMTLALSPHRLIDRYLITTGSYAPELVRFIRQALDPGPGAAPGAGAGVFLDVGANLGYFSLVAARALGSGGKVYAFEPSPREHALLLEHLSLNAVTNVVPFAVGLGDREERSRLWLAGLENPGQNSRHHGDAAGAAMPVEIALAPIGALLPAPVLRQVRGVKIDVEGDECAVLAGFADVMPLLAGAWFIVEVSPALLERAGRSVDELYRFFAGHGYRPGRPERPEVAQWDELFLPQRAPLPPAVWF
jgi:FkbM family methyltransferase